MQLGAIGHVPYETAGFGGPLVADWVGDFEKVRPFFRYDPRKEEDIDTALKALAGRTYERQTVAHIFEDACERYGGQPELFERAQDVLRPETFLIVTGQQAGLLGGPLYTLHKALTAIKLAREWNERFSGRARFLPVFWVASDDHDLQEIDHAFFLNGTREVQRVRAEWGDEVRGSCVADVSFSAACKTLREPLKGIFGEAVDEWLAPYAERNAGAAFAALLTKHLGALGLLVIESKAVRVLGAELFARELEQYSTTSSLIRGAGQKMRVAGYEPGLAEENTAPHLFVDHAGVRAALVPTADGAAMGTRSSAFRARKIGPGWFRLDMLTERAYKQPRDYSPSAALRPVLQDRALPVAATVLGPGEMAYWAQLSAVHGHFDAAWPVIVPRASMTLMDKDASRAFRKLELTIEDLFLSLEELKAKFQTGGKVSEVGGELAKDSEVILARLDDMHRKVREVDGGLDPLFQKARKRVSNELGRVIQKTKASIAQRENPAVARLEYLSRLTRPKGRPQERMLCWAQFVARDPELPARLLDALSLDQYVHPFLGPQAREDA
jgi:bacillithiol biosynthesis cysteine-adding enzyme BshC